MTGTADDAMQALIRHQNRYADQADDDPTAVHDTSEFDDAGRISKILSSHEPDAVARILAHLVAFFDLGEIYKCEVLHQQ